MTKKFILLLLTSVGVVYTLKMISDLSQSIDYDIFDLSEDDEDYLL